MNTEAEFKESLRQFVIAKNGKIKPEDLFDDTAIIELRIITSLQLMDLILHLEKITGEAIDIEQLKPGVFASINSIYKNFCETSIDVDKI